jgi:Cofactor assembly of complex C subunit B
LLWSSAAAPLFLLAAEAGATDGGVESTYSQNSYYATLFLFVLSFPGLYSLVKRSAKSKVCARECRLLAGVECALAECLETPDAWSLCSFPD